MNSKLSEFFKNFKEKSFNVINNGEFKDSPLSCFFNSKNIKSIKDKISNPFLLSSIAISISLSSLYLSINNDKIDNNLIVNKPIEDYLILRNIDDYYNENLEILLKGNKIEIYSNQHLLNFIFDENSQEFVINNQNNTNTLEELNWDYKTPAAPFEKYFSDEYKDKIPTLDELNEIEKFYGLPDNLLISMAHKESRLSLYKTSHKNAKGFLGFQEDTARDFSLVTDENNQIFNAYASADTAARYILWLNGYVNGKKSDIFDNKKDDKGYSNLDYALAAYNAGPHKVKRISGKRIPNFRETKNYIRDINLLLNGEGYIVEKGDTIYKIAKNHEISLDNLFRNNLDIQSNQDLKAGEILVISKNEDKELSLKVEKGLNMYTLSLKTGMDLEYLLAYNNLKEDSVIQIGQEIKIPPLTKTSNKKYSRKI